jgi:kynurenine formamidase
MQLIDLSHTIEPGMPIFSASAPQPKIYPWISHAQSATSGTYLGCSCEITEVRFLTSIGTYLDSPYHFHPEKKSIDALEVEQLVQPGVLVDCTDFQKRQPIGPEVLKDVDIQGKAVLFHTGWNRYWGKSDYREHPFLTQKTAEVLKDRGAKMAGVDFLVIDDTRDPKRPVHVILLKHDILIVENLTNLNRLPGSEFIFHAVPVKIAGAAAFPVRAYAAFTAASER